MINFIIESNILSIPDFSGLDIKSPKSSNMAAIESFFLVSKIEAMKKRKRKSDESKFAM